MERCRDTWRTYPNGYRYCSTHEAYIVPGKNHCPKADTMTVCPSCGRKYDEMPNRERMLNGHMGHLELDHETGATVLIDEGR